MRSFVGAITILAFTTISSTAIAKNNFENAAIASFSNLQATLQFQGEAAPYRGFGRSPLLGRNRQTGSILPDPKTVSLDESTGTLTFRGVQGPNPFMNNEAIHVIHTARGSIYCTWKAKFTAQFLPEGKAIFSGDGKFKVVGGTGVYKNATGSFRTLFATGVIDATSDVARARVQQKGQINRRPPRKN